MDSDNFRATGLMITAMALFAVEDFIVKIVSGGMGAGQILVILSLGGTAVFWAICRSQNLPAFTRLALHPLVMARNLSEGVASMCYVLSLTLIPLSLASAILQATPIFVTAGAALWLRESVGWRRWSAVMIGLLGVLVILRPGIEGFRPAALLAVAAVIGLAVRDVVSRRIPRTVATTQLSVWAYLSILPGGLILMATTGTPSAGSVAAWGGLGVATLVGAAAYFCLTSATRLGDVSLVIPFRYSRLFFAILLGVIFLGERPDTPTILGALIVVGSGLYALWRERQRQHALSTASPKP